MSDVLVKKGPDALSIPSRKLYERTLVKVVISICYAGLAMMFLGFTSETGGKSSHARKIILTS